MDMITIIGIVVFVVFGIIFFTVNKISKNKEVKRNSRSRNVSVDEKIETHSVKRKEDEKIPRKDMFDFMEFDKIIDNMILQDSGNKCTMVVQCKGINYDLMSDIEQMAVEEGFITFLNTLKFPIQLYVQATAVDLKKSMNIYQKSVSEIENKYSEYDDEYKKLSKDLNSEYEEIISAKKERARYQNILEYAEDITKYVEKLSLNKYMLQRKFYIILSYNKSEVNATAEFSSQEIHDICYRELYTRAQSLISGLMACSVVGKVLNSNELAELLYISYNRDDEKLIDVKTALESEFYRLYSTSKDVFEKKEELMQKEIQEEAARRVKQNIKEALQEGLLKTSEQLEEEFEDRADRTAIELINSSELEDKAKNILNEKIAEKHVVEAEKRRRQKNAAIKKNVEEILDNDDKGDAHNKEKEKINETQPQDMKPKENNEIVDLPNKEEEMIETEKSKALSEKIDNKVEKENSNIISKIDNIKEIENDWDVGGLREFKVEYDTKKSNENERDSITKEDNIIDENKQKSKKENLDNDESEEDELII